MLQLRAKEVVRDQKKLLLPDDKDDSIEDEGVKDTDSGEETEIDEDAARREAEIAEQKNSKVFITL